MPDKNQRQLEGEMLRKVDELIDCLMAGGPAVGDRRDQELKAGVVKIGQIADLFLASYPQAADYLDQAVKELVGQRLADPRLLPVFLNRSDNLEEILQEGLRQFKQEETVPFEPEGLEKPGWAGTTPYLTLVHDSMRLANGQQAPLDLGSQANWIEGAEGPGGDGADAAGPPESADQAGRAGPFLTDVDLGAGVQSPAKDSVPLDPLEWSLSVLYPKESRIANYTQGNRTALWYLPERKLALIWLAAGQPPEKAAKGFWEQRGIALVQLNQTDLSNHRAIERQIRRQLR